MARRALKAAAVVNGIGKLGRLFGLPTPVIPEDWMDAAHRAVGDIADKEDGSVADFAVMDAVFQGEAGELADEETGERRQQRQTGHCLREFKRFLAEKDKKNRWCDLSRVLLPGQDEAVWVCPACRTALEEGGGGEGDPLAGREEAGNAVAAAAAAAESVDVVKAKAALTTHQHAEAEEFDAALDDASVRDQADRAPLGMVLHDEAAVETLEDAVEAPEVAAARRKQARRMVGVRRELEGAWLQQRQQVATLRAGDREQILLLREQLAKCQETLSKSQDVCLAAVKSGGKIQCNLQ